MKMAEVRGENKKNHSDETLGQSAYHPKNPDPSKMAILRIQTPAIQVLSPPPLEGPWGFLGLVKVFFCFFFVGDVSFGIP